ncbi:MAG: hypothetical protein WD638_08845 [Nitriliruptoraceae bacterium]
MPLIVTVLLLTVLLVVLLRTIGDGDEVAADRIGDEDRDEPIHAVKRAHVRLAPDGTSATLTGLSAGGRYAIDARASCPRGCSVPTPACRCGFYAMHGDLESRDLSANVPWAQRAEPLSVRLDVELSGVVLEYELGYRAERQRVLEVGIPDRCVPCAAEGIDQQAAGLIARERRVSSPFGSGNPFPGDPELRGWLELRSACLDHWRAAPGLPALSLPELAELLGTRVTWEASGTAGSVGR